MHTLSLKALSREDDYVINENVEKEIPPDINPSMANDTTLVLGVPVKGVHTAKDPTRGTVVLTNKSACMSSFQWIEDGISDRAEALEAYNKDVFTKNVPSMLHSITM